MASEYRASHSRKQGAFASTTSSRQPRRHLWIGPDPENVARANRALAEFGSPHLLEAGRRDEVRQLGVAPNRIDLLQDPDGVDFDEAWSLRIAGRYGRAKVYWIDLDTLIEIKSRIDAPRHQEDARVLRQVRERRKE